MDARSAERREVVVTCSLHGEVARFEVENDGMAHTGRVLTHVRLEHRCEGGLQAESVAVVR